MLFWMMFCFDITRLQTWFFICVSKLSSSGRMSQNIINNWENLDQDCELLNLGKLMSQKQSNVCFNSSHLISTITTGTEHRESHTACLVLENSPGEKSRFQNEKKINNNKTVKFNETQRGFTRETLLLDWHPGSLRTWPANSPQSSFTQCKDQTRCTVCFLQSCLENIWICLTELSRSTFYHWNV